MIIEKKQYLFGRFGDFTPGTVFSDYYDGDVQETYMKMQGVIITGIDGHADTICNAVNVETGEWTVFNNDEKIIPYTSAKIILE